MAYMCPACNGLQELRHVCPNCGSEMTDGGPVMNLFDDYSPYEPLDQMKRNDGYQDDLANHICVHQLHCDVCGQYTTYSYEEWQR